MELMTMGPGERIRDYYQTRQCRATGHVIRSTRLAGVVLALILFSVLPGCSQWWQVRPYPAFVAAEIAPGDKIRYELSDGSRHKMTVEKVRADRIEGQNQVVSLDDMVSLEKYSEHAAANPCSPQFPLGCSVPKSVTVLVSSQKRYAEFFYPSCEQHDYCYRHGAATYGETQNSCDTRFLEDLQDQCSPDSFTKVLLQLDMNYAECGATAIAYYQAVQQYGGKKFNSTASSYCEYDGPP
jgi:hypothetical protein